MVVRLKSTLLSAEQPKHTLIIAYRHIHTHTCTHACAHTHIHAHLGSSRRTGVVSPYLCTPRATQLQNLCTSHTALLLSVYRLAVCSIPCFYQVTRPLLSWPKTHHYPSILSHSSEIKSNRTLPCSQLTGARLTVKSSHILTPRSKF